MVLRLVHNIASKALGLRGVGQKRPLSLVTPRFLTGVHAGRGSDLAGPQVGFITLGAHFDGTSDYMQRSTAGETDTKVFAMSVWVTTDTTGSSEAISGGNCGINSARMFKETDNIFDSTLKGSVGYIKHTCTTSSTFTAATDTWIHLAVCCDLANGSGETHMMVNGSDEAASITAVDDVMDHTCTEMNIGAGMGAGSRYTGAMAECLIWTDEYIDWSVAGNLAKVYNAGKPVDPGADGSDVTGSAPNSYCSIREGGAASDFATNLGSGGNFSITGSLVLHSSNPSD